MVRACTRWRSTASPGRSSQTRRTDPMCGFFANAPQRLARVGEPGSRRAPVPLADAAAEDVVRRRSDLKPSVAAHVVVERRRCTAAGWRQARIERRAARAAPLRSMPTNRLSSRPTVRSSSRSSSLQKRWISMRRFALLHVRRARAPCSGPAARRRSPARAPVSAVASCQRDRVLAGRPGLHLAQASPSSSRCRSGGRRLWYHAVAV